MSYSYGILLVHASVFVSIITQQFVMISNKSTSKKKNVSRGALACKLRPIQTRTVGIVFTRVEKCILNLIKMVLTRVIYLVSVSGD